VVRPFMRPVSVVVDQDKLVRQLSA
jgi:hypothetical protein